MHVENIGLKAGCSLQPHNIPNFSSMLLAHQVAMASLPSTTLLSPFHPPSRRGLSPRSLTILAASRESRPDGESAAGNGASSAPEKAFLKAAWYGSELLGIAASVFRPATPPDSDQRGGSDPLDAGGTVIGRDHSVEAIKGDFERSYFVTGNLTLNAYDEDCEFADPAGSFRGLNRFKRNCTNFGSLLVKSNMKLIKWEDYGDKAIGHWRFSCIMSFPWRPILSATGYTEYYFDPLSGKINRHVEHWNVPKMALFKQLLRPSRWEWGQS